MRRVYLSLLIFILLIGCVQSPERTTFKPSERKCQWYHIDVSRDIPEDREIVQVIKPYKEQEMSREIGVAVVDLTKGKPESTLGNFVADVILETARHFDKGVDCAVTNSGGLRAPIYAGKITVRDAFKLMPFQNRIVILRFSGKDFIELVREIVENRGEPVSGLTINVVKGVIDAYVKGKKIEDYHSYKVATIDYLYHGGGSLPVMSKGELVKDTHVLLRDAIIDYIMKHKKINEKIEGRILIQ